MNQKPFSKNKLHYNYSDADIRTADLSTIPIMQKINMLPNNIALLETIRGIGLDGYMNLQAAVLVLVRRGSAKVEMNLKNYEVKSGSLFVALPDQILRVIEISDDFEPCCIACSKNMIDELTTSMDDTTKHMLRVRENPIIPLSKSDFGRIYSSTQFLKEKFESTCDNVCQKQILKNILVALLYECLGIFKLVKEPTKPKSRKEFLFNIFIDNVIQEHRKEHSVQHYAELLGITPKYLSAVCEEISGKNAKRWIDEHIALDAKVLLRSTTRDIKEISDLLNFPDICFFGKFFRRMTGVSPKAFRKQKEV